MKTLTIHFFFLILTLSSCGLWRHTTHEKKVVSDKRTIEQSFVDTSSFVEVTKIDTNVLIKGSDEDIYYFPIEFDVDTPIIRKIENNRYKAEIKINPKEKRVTAKIKIKDIEVPVKMETIKKGQQNIHATSSINSKTKVTEKATEHKPTINWNWVIPICFIMLLFFVIIFFKTKKLFTLL